MGSFICCTFSSGLIVNCLNLSRIKQTFSLKIHMPNFNLQPYLIYFVLFVASIALFAPCSFFKLFSSQPVTFFYATMNWTYLNAYCMFARLIADCSSVSEKWVWQVRCCMGSKQKPLPECWRYLTMLPAHPLSFVAKWKPCSLLQFILNDMSRSCEQRLKKLRWMGIVSILK